MDAVESATTVPRQRRSFLRAAEGDLIFFSIDQRSSRMLVSLWAPFDGRVSRVLLQDVRIVNKGGRALSQVILADDISCSMEAQKRAL